MSVAGSYIYSAGFIWGSWWKVPKYKCWPIIGSNSWESFEPLPIRRRIWAQRWLSIGSWKFRRIYNSVFWGYSSKDAGDYIASPSCSGGSCFRRIAVRKDRRIWNHAYSRGCFGFGVRNIMRIVMRRSGNQMRMRSVYLSNVGNIHPWKMIFIPSTRIFSKNHWSAISPILNKWRCRIPSSMNQRQNRGPFRPLENGEFQSSPATWCTMSHDT